MSTNDGQASPLIRFARPGIFKARPSYEAYYARACRDCGALVPFLGAVELRLLNEEIDSLEDVEGYQAQSN
ncbi:hypothetical protein [Streptacidiphilus sp. P02-A3a]|uniref:hypothetical protein n=1 Tax=Streptacidiphilus sp. P02-A3a TaxID=2704468 RepID=UPI0015F9545F|nr:hypothetical protein [Streptacidiphilus sp. P02-A3a]QMU68245.1 hypothetical protein GXP74_08405 [Streptacidiphilus sp. P02-A3a]